MTMKIVLEDEKKMDEIHSRQLRESDVCNLNEAEIYVLMLIRRGDELKIAYSCSYMQLTTQHRRLTQGKVVCVFFFDFFGCSAASHTNYTTRDLGENCERLREKNHLMNHFYRIDRAL